MKHWRVGLLGLVVSLLAIAFIGSQINPALVAGALAAARYEYLLPTIALLLAGLVARAVRWRALLDGGLPLARAFSIMNVAYLVNGVLPLRIGEVARMFLAARADPPVPALKSASTIVVERLLDLLAVVALLTLALAASPAPDELRAAAAIGPAALAGFLVLVGLASQRGRALRLLSAAADRVTRAPETHPRRAVIARRLVAGFGQILDGLAPLARPVALLSALALTAISWSLSAAAGYVLMFAFYNQASWAATGLYIAAAALAIAVPAVPGNLGTYELSILLALGAVGYGEPRDVAAAFALVVHGVNVAVHAGTGVIGLIQEGISVGELSRGIQGIR